MGQITQTETVETTMSDVHNVVTEQCQSADITTFVLESDMLGFQKPEMSAFARKVRFGNSAFKNWSLPKVDGSVKQTNKSIFTSRYVWSNISLSDAVKHVIESGQFGDAVDELMNQYPDMPAEVAEAVMSYNLYIVAKGWVAESQVADKFDDMSKLWESNDLAGQDFQMSDTFIQLKSFTRGFHQNDTSDENGNLMMYWGWVSDRLVVSTDYTEVVSQIRDNYMVDFETVRNYEYFHDI